MTNQRSRVRVNGQTIHLGVRVLDSGDLIQSDCDVSPFTPAVSATRAPHTGDAITCARCTMPIEPGVTAARCACGALHHDAADWRCWSDFSTCALCSAPVEAAGEGA